MRPDCQIENLAALYARVFGYRKKGMFVEVGAYDGIRYSNTSPLAQLGWAGIYVEPVPKYFTKCRQNYVNYPSITVLNYAVGACSGKVQVHIGGVLSTISLQSLQNYKNLGWWIGTGKTVTVSMVTLEDLLRENSVFPRFDLLVIDVEGYEWEVLKNFPLDYWDPIMVIIELHDISPNYTFIRDQCLQIVDYFRGYKYRVAWKSPGNTVYISPTVGEF